ncbi:MAG: OB-fold nucleic acid binding domain-containing protein [Candidatus Pacearchaeota archaeon]|jgi:RPA family protein
MAEQQFKRNVAYKFRIGELFLGKPIFDEQNRFSFLELGNKKIIRTNLIGNIVDKFESPSDTKYIFFTLDDGSGQIKLKIFGEDSEKFRGISQGQTVIVIGVLRNWNDETYIQPEIIQEANPKYLLIRKLELEKTRKEKSNEMPQKEVKALKDKILDKIKNSEEQGGFETEKIILNFHEASPEIINQEIQKLLEEGIIFEPRPGRLRYLG